MQQKHGGNIWACSRMLGTVPNDIIDFSASISRAGGFSIEPGDMERLNTAISHYPDPDYPSLKEKIGAFHGVGSENVLPGNGSVELLYLLPKALKPSRVILPVPSFYEYERALNIENIDIEFLATSPCDGFTVPLKTLAGMVEPGEMVIFGNPGSPTGVFMERKDLDELVDACEKRKAWLCVDEAFIDFISDAGKETLIRESAVKKHLIVVRSFTKFFSIPGLRFGYMTSGNETVRKVMGVQPPWAVNAVSEYAALSILDEPGSLSRKILESIKAEREYIIDSFRNISSLKLYPAHANFFLAEILNENLDAETLVARLMEYGIMVRDCSGFRGLNGRFIRFSVRGRKDNTLLLEKFKEVAG